MPGVAAAAPCTPAAKAGLKVADPAGGGSLYATHELRVTPLGTGQDTSINSQTASAPGARRLEDTSEGALIFVRDTPGPLTVSAVVDTTDPSRPADDPGCSAAVSATVQLRPALAPVFSLKRPRRGKDGRGRLIYPDPPTFTITIKHRAGSSRLPITVRARATKRLKLPKKGAKAVSRTFAQRLSDLVDTEERGPGRCTTVTLICPRKAQGGWPKSTEVQAFPLESEKLFSNGLRVQLLPPTGYPPPFRRGKPQGEIKTPFGADIELLQAGRRIGRLRVVARCAGGGQSSRCRFRKISTKR